jgi:hypothetical protein
VPVRDAHADVAIPELIVMEHVQTDGEVWSDRRFGSRSRRRSTVCRRWTPEVRCELLLQEARARDEARKAQEDGDYDRAGRRLAEVSAALRVRSCSASRLLRAATLSALHKRLALIDTRISGHHRHVRPPDML